MFWIGFVGRVEESQHGRRFHLVCGDDCTGSYASDRLLNEGAYIKQWVAELTRLVNGESDRAVIIAGAQGTDRDHVVRFDLYPLYRTEGEAVVVREQIASPIFGLPGAGISLRDAGSLVDEVYVAPTEDEPQWELDTTLTEIREYLALLEEHGIWLATTKGITSPHRPPHQRNISHWRRRTRSVIRYRPESRSGPRR